MLNAYDLNRAIEMMQIAAQFIRDYCPEETVFYDDAICDGYCVADDLESAAEAIKEGE